MSLHLHTLGMPLVEVTRRPIPEEYNNPDLRAVCYSAYRGAGPSTDFGPAEVITDEMIRQDLALLKLAGFDFIRMFGADVVTSSVLRIMRAEFPGDFKMHMTIYLEGDGPINCQRSPVNRSQLDVGVALANEYDEIIVAVSIGNETSLAANLPISCLVQYIVYVRSRVKQPVTTDEWHTFWITNQCHPVLPYIDFVSLHTYATTDFQYWDWYQLDIDEGQERAVAAMEAAFEYTVDEYVKTYDNEFYFQNEWVKIGETMPIIIGETGWKYRQTNNYQTIEQYLARPVNVKWFFDKMREWQQSQTGPKVVIWFEAFNELWKGQDAGWGLWDENRIPLYQLCSTPAGTEPCASPDPYAEMGYFKQNGTGGSLQFGGYLNNGGQWIKVPASEDWTFGSDDNFTVEWWQRQIDFSYGNYPRIFAVGDYPNISVGATITDGQLQFWIGNKYAPNISYQFNFSELVNNWVHIAVERYNGILKIYVNGTSVASVADDNAAENDSEDLYIGAVAPPGDAYTRFPGNITNFRFVNKEAVYKGNFIPPNSPLTNTGANTKLLLLATKSSALLKDSSDYDRTVTNSTALPTSWSTFNPFVGGSFFFTASGQHVKVDANSVFNLGTSDFTLEWFQLQTQFGTYFYPRVFTFGSYPNIQLGVTQSGNNFQFWAGGEANPVTEFAMPDTVLNLWRHFVVQRANNELKIFINGLVANTVSDFTTSIDTTGTDMYIGAEPGSAGPYTYFPGYLTNIKFDTSANYPGNLILIPISPFEPAPNTIFLAKAFNSSEYLYDSSNNNFLMTTPVDNSVIYSSYSPFGD